MAAYEPVIGLEVHVQLKTATKIFCGCSTRFGDPPNSNTCPVCLGLPGSLPVLNRRALELALRASLALNLRVQENSRFARKNYFYPDLPKGYQISMYELPLALAGWLEIDHDGARKRIGITRLHLEEDAAKNLHEGFPDSASSSYIDYNRGGTPLAEIVSEPDLRSPTEAYAYLNALKQVLEYAEVSDCNMEEGSLRCDANVSVRKRGAERFGTKAEVKNLNSFRYLQRALEYEIERQIGVLESGGRILQETRLWDVSEGRTVSMRSKEFAHDYRYFPDPDLLPVRVNASSLSEIQRQMPELPEARRERFVSVYALSAYDAAVLTATRALADYFEAVVKAGAPAKTPPTGLPPSFSAGSTIPAARSTPARSLPPRWPICSAASRPAASPAPAAKKFLPRCSRAANRPKRLSQPKGFLRFRTPAKSSGFAARSSRKIPRTSPNTAPETKAYSSFLWARSSAPRAARPIRNW